MHKCSKNIARAILLAAEIREDSYVECIYGNNYTISRGQASTEACFKLNLDKQLAIPISLILYNWNEALDWANKQLN